jgi:hypothetical protein
LVNFFEQAGLPAKQGETMTRASIRVAATALALFLAAPPGLRADDPATTGGSPFGNALDEQKIRDDFAKLRQQIEQNQGEVLRQNKSTKFHRWSGSGTKGSARDKGALLNNLSERRRDRRDWQRDRNDPQRSGTKRNSGGSSSRGSGSGNQSP